MNEELIKVLQEVRKLRIEADAYLDSLPSDLSPYVMDNTYVNAVSMIGDKLLKRLFGTMYEDVSWFLYEFKPRETPQIWLADGTPITLNSDDDYYNYLRAYG